MSPNLLVQRILKCLNDSKSLKMHSYEVNPVKKSDSFFPSLHVLYYCTVCKAYATKEGMEKDPKKAILAHRYSENGKTIEEKVGDINVKRIKL